jgi:hypothetical protein
MNYNFAFDPMSEFATWNTFYEIVGSSAGTLIGLQFVMMTLIAQRPALRGSDANAAFGTPTIVHFSTALILSALVVVPWPSIAPAAAVWGIIGGGGVLYALIVARRMLRQTVYTPVFEDWLFHAAMPLLAYAILALAAVAARSHTHEALFGVGAAALLMLFIGIHNAWDSVSFHVFAHRD